MLKQMLQAIANKNVPWKVKVLTPFRFAKAMARAIYYKIIGRHIIVDDRKEKDRMTICNLCINNDLGTCLVCGCCVELKTMMSVEVCPIGKWD